MYDNRDDSIRVFQDVQETGDTVLPFPVGGVSRSKSLASNARQTRPKTLCGLTTLLQHLQLVVHIKDALCLPNDLLQLAILDL